MNSMEFCEIYLIFFFPKSNLIQICLACVNVVLFPLVLFNELLGEETALVFLS